MAMYAKGMSQRDIEDTLKEIYGAEISQGLVSRITDKILPEVNEWQNRPLDSIYPVVFFDGIVFNSRKDNKIINKCVYTLYSVSTWRVRRRFLEHGFLKMSQQAFTQVYAQTLKTAESRTFSLLVTII